MSPGVTLTCAVGIRKVGPQRSYTEQKSPRQWGSDLEVLGTDMIASVSPSQEQRAGGHQWVERDESLPRKAHVNKHPRLPWWAQWVPPPLLHPAGMRLKEDEVMSAVGAPGLAVRE